MTVTEFVSSQLTALFAGVTLGIAWAGWNYQRSTNRRRNAVNVKPLNDYVMVTRLDEAQKTPGGIVIPENAREKGARAKVVAVGSGKRLEDGTVRPLLVKSGDVVLLQKWGGSELNLGGEEYLMVREAEILAVEES